MRRFQYFIFLSAILFSCYREDKNPNPIKSFLVQLESKAPSINTVDEWKEFLKSGTNPFVSGDSVMFMYYGAAEHVQWVGDFTGWSQGEPKAIGNQIENSNIWYGIISLPEDARVDYKIIVDGNWILDPDNDSKQMAGVGGGTYNSELRMPSYLPDTTGTERVNIPKGEMAMPVRMRSKSLGYEINYSVYTPSGYDRMAELPSLFVMDGQEYSNPELGNMVNILDNLIADKKIEPLIVVFMDPRNPDNPGENRRMSEYVLNESFVNFLVEELVPKVDSEFKTSAQAEDRGILGTSLGGLNAAYVHAMANQSFKRIGINSPAFSFREKIFDIYDTLQAVPARIIMTTGNIHDTEEGARKMKNVMEVRQYPLKYIEISQGHSWGNWEFLLDDVLMALYGLQE